MSNQLLQTKDFYELDNKIDAVIENSSFLSYPRDVAIFHILLAYDQRCFYIDQKADLSIKNIAIQQAYRALNHSMILIHKFCPTEIDQGRPIFNETIEAEAYRFFMLAEDFSILWSEMSKLHRGRNKCLAINDSFYEFSPSTLLDEEMDCSRSLIDKYDDPENSEDVKILPPNFAKKIYDRLFITWNGRHKFSYKYLEEVFSQLKFALEGRTLQQWFMGENWDLGGYTFFQVKEFWLTLLTNSVIHQIALDHISVMRHRKTLSLQIKSFEDWVNDISKKSKLSKDVCKIIFNDLIYNEHLYNRPKKKKPEVMFTPFFRLQNGEIMVCDRIVQITNIERNIWSLADIIPKPNIDKLKNLKEKHWITELMRFLNGLDLQCFPNINYKSGDIDLLIIDLKLNFGLVCELKWLTYSDDINGVTSNDEVILTKISQATKAVEWIANNKNKLSQKTGISEEILRQIEFKPLFILKESFASGFINPIEVPVINEKLFYAILNPPICQNIKNLWQISHSKSYLARKNEHFRESYQTIFWGKLKFRISCVEILKRWNPQTDIKGLI